MIRKRGIIATVILISLLVNAIPLVSSLFEIYNEPLDLDSPLVFSDVGSATREEYFETTKEEDYLSNNVSKEIVEAPKIEDYTVTLTSSQSDNIKLSQEDFTVVITGKVRTEKGDVLKKISFDFYAPCELPDNTLEDLSVKIPESGQSYTQKKNKIIKEDKRGISYFTVSLDIENKKDVPVEVNWGDGFVITYVFQFNLEN